MPVFMNQHLRPGLSLVAIFLLSCTAAFPGGAVKGKVIFDGEIPPRNMVNIPLAQVKNCGLKKAGQIPDNDLIISKDGGVKDFVITLTREGQNVKPVKAVYDQKGCMFLTPVLIVPEGSTVEFKNSDPGIHNVRTTTFKNKPKNAALMSGMKLATVFKAAEKIKLNCDFHPWMKGYIAVVKTNHYALTGKNGAFEIKDVPAGEYKFAAWHPVLGKAKIAETGLESRSIKVEGGKTVSVTIKKKPKKKKK